MYLFIQGGAFNSGSGNIPLYDGANLAGRGVLVMTINHSLGGFGFLAYPDLPREGAHESPGNSELLDPVAALRGAIAQSGSGIDIKMLRERYGAVADRFLALYLHATDADAIASTAQIGRDRTFASFMLWTQPRRIGCPADALAGIHQDRQPGLTRPAMGGYRRRDGRHGAGRHGRPATGWLDTSTLPCTQALGGLERQAIAVLTHHHRQHPVPSITITYPHELT
ncbi:carboxylesterase family protein [Massilia sp. HP4]|uniref:carboxylesterase family protein n=1 Tax=Massilia sp. HP4 TaxID=2562316 RepID=UPI00227719C6